ncbi:MAG TPA: serine protease, partial [Archangium sp.]
AWRTKLALREAAVARVEIRRNGMWKPAGTGFLVGADLLLTNQHVVRGLLGRESVTGELRFRFDFKRTVEGGTPQAGIFVEPAAGDWLVLSASPSAVDELKDPGDQEPAEGELDFALIRLAVPVGLRPIGTLDEKAPGRARGWMRLVNDTSLTLLGEGQSVFILQHPEGDALQISFGDFLRVGPQRVRYNANTLRGSSGSPCLDARLDLVALHQAGDASHAAFDKAGYNQGIPIHRIAATCEAAGVTFEPPPA